MGLSSLIDKKSVCVKDCHLMMTFFSNCLSLCKDKVKNRKPEEQLDDLDQLLAPEELDVNFWKV